jgi:hypothetical protein
MTTDTLIGRDIFVRHTDKDGHSSVQQHRVWDAERFIASLQAATAKVNADERGGGTRLAKATQITHDQYLQERIR